MEVANLYEIYKQYPSVKTDTRTLKSGDIFFALKGPSFNGNEFAKKALELGAAYVVIDEPEFKINEKYILVNDVLKTLQELATYHRKQFSIPFIAITGSNGKTTSKELIAVTLQKKYKTYATYGNLNNHIGVPLTILSIKQDAEIAIIEMGANHQKEIESYCKIALPTYGIITNCGKAHIEGFGGIEGVKKGKGELYDYLKENNGTIFRNVDLDYLQEMSKGITSQITYGTSNAQYIGKVLNSEVLLSIAVLSQNAETTIHTALVGDYNLPNVMLAVAVGMHFGIAIDDIKDAIEQYVPDNSRSQLLKVGSNNIILDAYNANPTSMRAAINNFSKDNVSDKILWIGGMKEMGKEEKNEHQALVEFIAQNNWKQVILVGKEFEGLENGYLGFENSEEASKFIAGNKPQNVSILIKGSRGSKMELLLAALKN